MTKREPITAIASYLLILFFLGNDLMASASALSRFEELTSNPITKRGGFWRMPTAGLNDAYIKDRKSPKEGSENKEDKKNERVTEGEKKPTERSITSTILKDGSVVYFAEGEAYLGGHEKDPMEYPNDNIFIIETEINPSSYEYVYLSYSIQGLEDGVSITKSINGSPAYTGLPIRYSDNTTWQKVNFELTKEEVKKGYNTVRFDIPPHRSSPVTVKDVELRFTNASIETRKMERAIRTMALPEEFSLIDEETPKAAIYSVKALDMPSIPKEVKNVSKNGEGYLLETPHDTNVRFSIGVNSRALIGGSLSQVQVYYFDKESKFWKTLHVDKVDMANASVEATGPSNTNYFAGLITVPEMPEASAFVPTAISDIKAANPSAGMNIMQPPSISNTGEASIQYPLEIPQGRQGMTPNLTLTYSSDAGTGWLGVGWNISVPNVSIDSRWGVPTFPENTQEEVYLLNGSSLTSEGGIKANRVASTRKEGNVRFFEQTMTSYKEIERIGDGPDEYVWVETLANQTKYYYGTDDGESVLNDAVLKDREGNIVKWYLRKVKDKWGNVIRYSYENNYIDESGSLKNGTYSITPSSIEYTAYENDGVEEAGKYSIEFITSSDREDAKIIRSLGEELDDKLLEKIIVKYDDTKFKEYRFKYDEGDFFKTLLKKVEEYRSDVFFYDHEFEYYSDVLEYDDVGQTVVLDKINTKILDEIPDELTHLTSPLITHLTRSPINTSETFAFGAGGSLGLGVAPGLVSIPSKTFTLSGSLGFSESTTKGKMILEDFNGDGILDVGTRHFFKLRYYPLMNDINGDLISIGHNEIKSSGNFSESKSNTKSWGVDFTLPLDAYFFGMNWSRTRSETSTYFTDYNADGIKDFVNGTGLVHFGHLSAEGDLSFLPTSQYTHNPVLIGAISDDEEEEEPLKDMEIVKVWVAPFTGTIDITGTATIIDDSFDDISVGIQKNNSFLKFTDNSDMKTVLEGSPQNMNRTTGVVKGDTILFRSRSNDNGQGDLLKWDPEIEYTNLSTDKIDANGIDYGSSKYSDAFILSGVEGVPFPHDQHIKVSWPSFSVNNLSDDVTFKVHLKYLTNTQPQSIVKEKEYEYTVDAGTSTTPGPGLFKESGQSSGPGFMTSMQLVPTVQDGDMCYLSFEISSNSNVDWKAIDWRPKVEFGAGECGESFKAIYPVVYKGIYNRVDKMDGPAVISSPSPADNLRTWPVFSDPSDNAAAFSAEEVGQNHHHDVYFVSKKEGGLLSKIMLRIKETSIEYYEVDGATSITKNGTSSINSFIRSAVTNNTLYTGFYAPNKRVAEYLSTNAQVELLKIVNPGVTNLISTISNDFNVFYKDFNFIQENYRHWGQFCWSNDNSDYIPIKELVLPVASEVDDNDYSSGSTPGDGDFDGLDMDALSPLNQKFFVLMASRGENYKNRIRSYIGTYYNGGNISKYDRWVVLGTYMGVYGKEGATTPGKFGEVEEMSEETPDPVSPTGYSAYSISTKSESFSKGVSAGPGNLGGFSVSLISSNSINNPDKFYSKQLSSFMDINGDGYMDILQKASGGINANLTNPLGQQISVPNSISNGSGDIHLSKSLSESTGMVASGSYANEDIRFTESESEGASISGSALQSFDYPVEEWNDINGDGLVDRIFKEPGGGYNVQMNYGRQEFLSSAVSLNLPISGLLSHSRSASKNLDVGLSKMKTKSGGPGYGFSMGVGVNSVTSKATCHFMDLNGDGLTDIIEAENQEFKIYINKGASFGLYGTVTFDDNGNILENRATGITAKVAGTLAAPIIPLVVIHLKLSGSLNGHANYAVNKQRSVMRDINGDGIIDFIRANDDGNLEVYKGSIGKSNLLKTVKNPLKGSFTIDYKREGNKYGLHFSRIKLHDSNNPSKTLSKMAWDMPFSKWVMAKLTIHDGLELEYNNEDIDGYDDMEYTFNYDGGIKSRRERDFIGFSRVETKHRSLELQEPADGETTIIDYITEVTDYERPASTGYFDIKRCYFLKGIPKDQYTLHHRITKESTADGSEIPNYTVSTKHNIYLMNHIKNTFDYRDVVLTKNDPNFNGVIESEYEGKTYWKRFSESGAVFPALIAQENIDYPQTIGIEENKDFNAVKHDYSYDNLFNVTRCEILGSDKNRLIDSIAVDTIYDWYYEYETHTFTYNQLWNHLPPFDTPAYEDPYTGEHCFIISQSDPNNEFVSDTLCISPEEYIELPFDPHNYPCHNIDNIPSMDDEFEIILKQKTLKMKIIKEPVYGFYEARIIAQMSYFGKGQASGQSNVMKTHTIYVGVENPSGIVRKTEVSNLYEDLAPRKIKNYLEGSTFSETTIEYEDGAETVYGNVFKIKGPKNHNNDDLDISYEYDSEVHQFVTKVINESYNEEACYLYEYETGNLLEQTDVNGNSTGYVYDDMFRLIEVFGPREFSNPSSAATIAFEYTPHIGVAQNSLFQSTPVAITKHNMGVDEAPYVAGNKVVGNCTQAVDLSARPDMTSSKQTYTFIDGLQRVIQVKERLSSISSSDVQANGVLISGITAYDHLGRAVSTTLPVSHTLNVAPTLLEHIDFMSFSFTNNLFEKTDEYDYASRPLTSSVRIETANNFAVTTYEYDWDSGTNWNMDLELQDPRYFYVKTTLGDRESTDYIDVWGDKVAHKASGDIKTFFSFDPLHQLMKVKDPVDLITEYTYDDFGRMVEENHPDRGVRTYTYDLAGNLIKIESAECPAGIEMVYDHTRLIERKMPESGDINDVKYFYGNTGDGDEAINGIGRLVKTVQGKSFKTEEYEYDELGNLVKEYKNIVGTYQDERDYTTEFRYDSWGRIRWIKYPDNEEVSYLYKNGNGELKKISSIAGPGERIDIISNVLYDGYGNIKHLYYGNDTHTEFSYYANNKRLQDVDVEDKDGTALLDKGYSYHAMGYGDVVSNSNASSIYTHPITSVEMGGPYIMSYTYDNNGRLTNVGNSYFNSGNAARKHVYTLAMEYNDAGSIIRKDQGDINHVGSPYPTDYELDYNYHSGNHQLENVELASPSTTTDYVYNAEGSIHIVGGGTDVYLWDELQQLSSAATSSGAYKYIYDQNGERIIKNTFYGSGGANNGEGGGSSGVIDPYMLYLNPYYVARVFEEDVEATKHYYMGSQRIATNSVAYIVGAEYPFPPIESPGSPETPGVISSFATTLNTLYEMPLDLGIPDPSTIDYNTLFTPHLLAEEYDLAPFEEAAGLCEEDPQCLCELNPYLAAVEYGIDCIETRVMYWYHPDYLGNTEWVSSRDGYAHQFFWYSPWGEVLHEDHRGRGKFESMYRFNAKELDPETGNYYYGARYYDPRISIFVSVDPLAEEFAGWTPYHYVHNNPINMVDPTGMAAEHIDVTKNEDGTYKVVGGQANSDKNIYVVDGNGKRTGEVVGEMLTEYSFHHEDGSAVIGANINLNDQSGQNFMDNEIKNIGLIDYISNAKGKEPLDFKHRGMPKGATPEEQGQHHYRGMSFNGKVASARDIGNYAAGYVAGKHGFGWGSSRFAFDALQTKQEKGTWNTVLYYPFNRVREGQPTQQAERAGHNTGYSIFKQRQFERQWQKATTPLPIGPKW